MYLMYIFMFFYLITNARCEYFDSYRGVIITEEQVRKYEKEGNLEYCTNNIKLPCDPNEWRRLDGSCNNLKHPSYGTVNTPSLRLLEPVFGEGLTDRKSETGEELPLVRVLRTKILKEGIAPDPTFTQLMTYFLLYSFTDVGTVQDTTNYNLYITYCCEPRGRGDYKCTPHEIPEKDPVHRFSHVRCMNQTRPITFQTYGCLQNGTTIPVRVSQNGVFGGKFIAVLLIRLHNYIAKQLAALNPCWDDTRLFYTARDINIAIEMQILIYELMAELMGRNNLKREQIISHSPGFRDLYDENILPQVSEEYIYCLRYFHTVQDADIRLYDNKGIYYKTYPMTNLTLKTGYFLPDKNFEGITQSSFRQACAKFDSTVDPKISEVGLGPLQYSSDITMNDLAKGRTIGFQGYVKYLEYCSSCSGKKYRTFEDLLDVMDQDRMEILRDSYSCLGDIDLMAGIWSERLVPGGNVPHTLYCLFVDQLKRYIKSERHWYERKDRPHAFTKDQLLEIRKISIARVMCDVGDSVTEIQKKAFLRIGPKNPLVSCKEIPEIDFGKWKDKKCER